MVIRTSPLMIRLLRDLKFSTANAKLSSSRVVQSATFSYRNEKVNIQTSYSCQVWTLFYYVDKGLMSERDSTSDQCYQMRTGWKPFKRVCV
jgi:hypothetical protein